MIPKIIHYCWFGRGEMPELALKCIESWHHFMPDYQYVLWNEDSFDVASYPYAEEAYEAKKYAFVSDVARLYALAHDGGIYLDTDVLLFKSFEPLLKYHAFAGFEGSKYCPIGTCVIGSEAHGEWVNKQLAEYEGRHFVLPDGTFDLITNVSYITGRMIKAGFVSDGRERDFDGLHVFPVDYFCPRHTTGEYIRTENTYCEHLGIGSWAETESNWKSKLLLKMSPSLRVMMIKMKRKIFG
ncbi:MAG: glycosyl transferase [Prevotella sp.]|nr:glycosyl transferase [Prevotella sp.]